MPKRPAIVTQDFSSKKSKYAKSKKAVNKKWGNPGYNPIEKYFETKSARVQGTEVSGSSGIANPVFVHFPGIGDGVGSNKRVANRVTAKQLSGTVLFRNNGVGYVSTLWVREMVVAIPGGKNVTDAEIMTHFFDTVGTSADDPAGFNDLRDIIRLPNRDGMMVLRDTTFPLYATGDNHTGYVHQTKFNYRVNQRLTYDDGDISEEANNMRYAYIVVARNADADTTSTVYEYTYNFEMKYKDI